MGQADADYTCAVPGCNQPVLCGWRDVRSDKGLQTCAGHLRKNKDPDDPFSFYLLLKIPVPSPERKDSNTMAKQTKKTKRTDAAGTKIATLFTKKGVKMKTREIETALNKGKKPAQQTSIHAIRAAIKTLIQNKTLVVVEVVSKQFVLAKAGTPVVKVSKTKKAKKAAKKKKKG